MSRSSSQRLLVLVTLGILASGQWFLAPERSGRGDATADNPPTHVVDPFWPKPLPNAWGLGQVAGVATDVRDHVWIIQRQRTLTDDEKGAALTPPRSTCCKPAPSVMEFDADGNFVQGWGGPGHHPSWPAGEHGIFVDHKDNVWIAGNAENDHVVLKFTRDGRFLLQIGEYHKTGGSGHTRLLGRPADIDVDPRTNEAYIADGYRNRRVIVFDADTGVYKRHWGAYGKPPGADDQLPAYDPKAPAAQTFRNPVHCVKIAKDGLVYVCDRTNNRIQVFQKEGTFVREFFLAKVTLGNGAVWDLELSPDRTQSYLYAADGENNHVWVLLRGSGEAVSRFGQNGRYAGQFHWIHNLASDSKGNIYTTEVDTGKRVQKFRLTSQLPR